MAKKEYKCVRNCFDNQKGQYYSAGRSYPIDEKDPLGCHFVDEDGKPLRPIPPELTAIPSGRMSKPTTEERLEQAVAALETREDQRKNQKSSYGG
jgi:hypothetical protein